MIHVKGNGTRLLTLLPLFLAAFVIYSCATMQKAYHQYIMKGSIVEASDSDVYLCIGSKDGATVGQELDVYRIISMNVPKNPTFRREYTGKVKIEEIVDEHFAKAKVISGKAEKNSIVELSSP